MKLISYILSLLICMLTMIPCSDGLASNSTGCSHVQEAGEDHSQEEEDHCTPFCSCHCCGISVKISDVLHFEMNSTYFNPIEHSSLYLQCYKHEHKTCVWHPPTHS